MVYRIIPAIAFIFLLGSCSSLKPLQFTSNKQVNTDPAPQTPKTETRFLEDITVTPQSTTISTGTKPEKKETVVTRGLSLETQPVTEEPVVTNNVTIDRSAALETATAIQLKYAVLLNTEVEFLQNVALLEEVDQWYGTRYRMGGTTRKGVDCSAFVGAVYAGAFGITLPRTARGQYSIARKISRTELQEGDLLFFNTRGGISHVGIYLHNNKFIHASVSKGVTVSDMFDPYYIKRFVSAGRIDNKSLIVNREP